jgi:dihydroflavonol-4-reductase
MGVASEQRTAFVTGANGFVGLHVVQACLAAGWRVVAMHRQNSDVTELAALSAERVIGDVTDPHSLAEAMPQSPDAVIHVAGNTSLWLRVGPEQMRVNVRGTRNVARAALAAKARRFIHISSVVAYGMHSGVISESTPSRGSSSRITYVRSKAMAEREIQLALRHGLPAIIINPANIIGAHDHVNWSRLFRLVAQRRLPGLPSGGGSFCSASAVAKAVVTAIDRGRVGSNYLLGGADASYVALARQAGQMLGHRVRLRTMPLPLLHAYAQLEEGIAPLFGRPPDVTRDAVKLLSGTMYCASSRARKELAYVPVKLETMLRECIDWMRASGMIRA